MSRRRLNNGPICVLWIVEPDGFKPLPDSPRVASEDDLDQIECGYKLKRIVVGKGKQTAEDLLGMLEKELPLGTAITVYDPADRALIRVSAPRPKEKQPALSDQGQEEVLDAEVAP